jgi:hypothetical protein
VIKLEPKSATSLSTSFFRSALSAFNSADAKCSALGQLFTASVDRKNLTRFLDSDFWWFFWASKIGGLLTWRYCGLWLVDYFFDYLMNWQIWELINTWTLSYFIYNQKIVGCGSKVGTWLNSDASFSAFQNEGRPFWDIPKWPVRCSCSWRVDQNGIIWQSIFILRFFHPMRVCLKVG